MSKGGIKIWGGAIALVGILAAAGFVANNQFVSGIGNTASRNSGNPSYSAENGGTININSLPSSSPISPTPSLIVTSPSFSPPSPIPSLTPSPSFSPSSLPSLSPVAPTAEKLEVECENIGAYVSDYTRLISVANRVEEPRARFNLARRTLRSLVCKIIENSGELSLNYALPDNSLLSRFTLKVYVDGVLQKSIEVSRGEAVREKINVAGATGFKLDFSVPETTSRSDYVYTLK